jgi:mannose-1-phosphate guanylyltransferase
VRGAVDLHAVIIAGGKGTRFWPLSRARMPKQFLPIASSRTMLEETVRRILPLVPPKKILTVANAAQTKIIARLLPRFPKGNLLVEPAGRNTGPSLLLAMARIFLKNPDAVVAVLPADHVITDIPTFLKKMEAAAAAAASEEALIIFGVPPTFPSSGFGYIHCRKENFRNILNEKFFEVASFKEKPSYDQALEFIREGNHFWNSGMFIWRAGVFARKMENCAPDFHEYWLKVLDAVKSKSKEKLEAVFKEIPAISIDYALMEKARGVLACEGNFGWSDVGAWSALAGIWDTDAEGNAVVGESVILDCRNAICYNPGKLTALLGVEDLIVINTKDVLLVCRKDQDQRVKEILEILTKKGKGEFL